MWKNILKYFFIINIIMLFTSQYNHIIYANNAGNFIAYCNSEFDLFGKGADVTIPTEDNVKVQLSIGKTLEQDKKENGEPIAEFQGIDVACDETKEDCSKPTSSTAVVVEPPMDTTNPFEENPIDKQQIYEDCVDNLIEKAIDEAEQQCIDNSNGDKEKEEECIENIAIAVNDIAVIDIEDCYENNFKKEVEETMDDFGETVHEISTSSCHVNVKYRDMEWEIGFDGYKVRQAVNDDTFAFLLWDGEVSSLDSTEHDPIYVVANLDMKEAEYIMKHTSEDSIFELAVQGASSMFGNEYIGDNEIKTYQKYEPKTYSPNGYKDRIIKDENQLFDYYIMVIDNPKSRWSGQYHIIEEDIYGDRLEKTTKEETQILFSSEIEENRGTNYIKRLRYSDITYKRYFEIKSDWICRLYIDGIEDDIHEFKDVEYINAIDGSWPEEIEDNISNQSDGWSIGAPVTVSIKTYADGTDEKIKIIFPHEFSDYIDESNQSADYNGSSYEYLWGKNPHFLNAEHLARSFNDVYLKQQALKKDNISYGTTERGKILIGQNTSYEDNYVFDMHTVYMTDFKQNEENNEDLNGNLVTDLKLGEWLWLEHQNGIINQVFYIQPELSTITIPGKEWHKRMCIGQYHCQCEDINVLCSCEDEEAGCNDDDGSKDGDCPENGPVANNIGGCDDSQRNCNEYGELVDSKGKMVIITNEKGYQVPSGGCGGVTGEGSTAYYEQYINSSTTLVE